MSKEIAQLEVSRHVLSTYSSSKASAENNSLQEMIPVTFGEWEP